MKSPKAVTYSMIALMFLVLSFTTYWLFIALATFFSYLGWKELFKRKTKF